MCIFGRRLLRGPMVPTPAVHIPAWCSLYWNHWALWPPACGKKEEEATLTFGDKTPKSPNGDFHFALCPFVCCCYCIVVKLCPILCDPMGCSPSGSSVHGISQARILEWVAMPSSRRSSWPRDRTHVSCTGRWVLYHWATWNLARFVCPFLLGHLLHSSVGPTCQVLSGPLGMPTWQGIEASGYQPVRVWCLKAHWQPLLDLEMSWLTVWLQPCSRPDSEPPGSVVPGFLTRGSWLPETVTFTVV